MIGHLLNDALGETYETIGAVGQLNSGLGNMMDRFGCLQSGDFSAQNNQVGADISSLVLGNKASFKLGG